VNTSAPVMITINVRPVNDVPAINPSVVGTGQVVTADNAWSVASNGTITYTLPESKSSTTSPFLINMFRPQPATSRVGLLDPYTVGPANEASTTVLGGSQTLRLTTFPTTTVRGGTLTPVLNTAGDVVQLRYTPPLNYNSEQEGNDSFDYTFEDNAAGSLGETFDLATGQLIEDRRSRTGRVEFVINPVNDAPVFTIASTTVAVLEDSGAVSLAGFATNIGAGPAAADDELADQTIEFTVTPLSVPTGLFVAPPTISDNGTLSFTTVADAVGTATFTVVLTDSGSSDAGRGDVNTTAPVTITIHVRPVNDAPRLNSAVIGTGLTSGPNEAWSVDSNGVITYTMPEDNTQSVGNNTPFVIDVVRSASAANRVGLLDVFTVGPNNETGSGLGGSQTLRILSVPATTEKGGVLTVLARNAAGFITRIGYVPAANYNSAIDGNDSFTYVIEDDSLNLGETWDLTASRLVEDRKTREGRVEFLINALNDAPQFAGADDVTVNEDSTTTANVGESVIPGFVTSVFAGPVGASDERAVVGGQAVSFELTAAAGNPTGLFSVAPTVDATGTLRFRTAANANGVATFTIVAVDTGSSTAPLQTNRSQPVTFVINVNRVNDPPSFVAGTSVSVAEDSGAFTSQTPFATQIVPGPANEIADGQTVSFVVTVPQASRSLFAVQPTINSAGFLSFTPAANAVGSVVVSVAAVDSLNASSPAVNVTITIREVNDTPVASDFVIDSDEDNAILVTREQFLELALDPDLTTNTGETLDIELTQGLSTSGATLSLDSDGNVLYDPRGATAIQALRPGQTLTDRFTYRLSDLANATSALATVTIRVAGRNDAPVANDDVAVLLTGVTSTLRPLANDTDVDGTLVPGSIIITEQPTLGSLSIQNDGTLLYTPRDGVRGQDIIRYTIGDNLGQQSEQASITLDVAPAPAPVDVTTGTYIGESFEIDLVSGIADPDNTIDRDSIEIVRAPQNGVVTILADGKIEYRPDAGFVGTDSFDYTIADSAGRVSDPITVTIRTVNSRLQNPQTFADVNANGRAESLDALLIINYISRSIRRGDGNSVPVLDSDRGPNFFDVDGNRAVTANDALRVINAVARQNRARLANGGGAQGEGEALLAASSVNVATINQLQLPQEPVSTNMVSSTDESPLDLAILASVSLTPVDEAITLIAWDAVDSDEDEEERLAALDMAWSDFSDL
jgi:VCBS repeat-containing protein